MALGNPHLLTSLRPTFLPPGLEALITPTKHQTPLLSSSAWAPQRLPLKESRPALFTPTSKGFAPSHKAIKPIRAEERSNGHSKAKWAIWVIEAWGIIQAPQSTERINFDY